MFGSKVRVGLPLTQSIPNALEKSHPPTTLKPNRDIAVDFIIRFREAIEADFLNQFNDSVARSTQESDCKGSVFRINKSRLIIPEAVITKTKNT
jgi:hypothetical protein